MRKIIALALWGCADALELIRGGLLAGALALLGEEDPEVARMARIRETFGPK